MAHQTDAPYQKSKPNPRWAAVDEYSFHHLHSNPTSTAAPSLSVLEAAHANAEKEVLPDIAVSPSQGKLLKLQAQLSGAKNILEVGTLGGYSTIWLASAGPDVHIVSVEVNPHHAAVARANIANAGYADRVEIRVGAGVEVLLDIAEEVKQGKREKFDFVFIDADKENNWNYVSASLDMCRSGAVIVVDNVVRDGRLAIEGTGDSRVEGARLVVENVGKDERLDGVVVQTVGGKSYDGFLVAIVK